MFRKPAQLRYFFAETESNSSLIVTLIGSLVQETSSDLSQVIDSIALSPSKWVIINFRDVSEKSDPLVLSYLKILREKVLFRGGNLIFSGVHPKLLKMLQIEQLDDSVVICSNLAEAVTIVPPLGRPKAA